MERGDSRRKSNPEQDGSPSGSPRGGEYTRRRATTERSKSLVTDKKTNLSSARFRRLASDVSTTSTNDASKYREEYKRNFHINDKLRAEAILKQIRDCSKSGEYDQAEKRLEGFNQLLEGRFGQDYHHPYEEGVCREFAYLYTAWGKSELDKGNFGEAESKFKLAEKVIEKRLRVLRDQALSKRDGGCDIADTKGRLGVLYAYWGLLEQEQGKSKQAKEKFEQAKPHLEYAVRNRAHNLWCEDRGAKKADKLGVVYTMLNEPHEAKKAHEMARNIRRKELKLGGSDLARVDHNLGLDYAKLGKLDLAQWFLQRASDSYKEVKRSMINRLALEVPNKPEPESEDLKVLKDLANRYFLEVRSNSEHATKILQDAREMQPSKRTIPQE
jgi:tetratricopeptide (TPR) repeat protein